MMTRPCKCAHPELDHPGGECIRPLCGCGEYREDKGKPAAREEGDAA